MSSHSRICIVGLLLIIIIICYRYYIENNINNNNSNKNNNNNNDANPLIVQTYPELSLITNENPIIDLKNLVIGKSHTNDYRGQPYYYFVFNPAVDVYVSKSMHGNGGVWEPFLNDLLLYLVNKERNATGLLDTRKLLVMDCGANLGSFTLYAGSLGTTVLAFEMQKLVYTVLEMSVRVSGYSDHVFVHNAALWNETITVSYNDQASNYGGTWMRQDRKGKSGSLQSIRLDSLPIFSKVKDIFFIKLDMEGAEERALMGFDSVIDAKRVKHIAIGDSAGNHIQLYKWLYRIGYTCRNYGPAETSSLNAECRDLEKTENCYWPTFKDLRLTIASMNRGHLNVLCSLP